MHATPVIRTAGRFPLHDEHFATTYLSLTHAIHLYDYHGRIRFGENEFDIAPGVVTISPAGGVTSYHVPRKGYHLCIHFHPVKLPGPKVKIPLYLPPGVYSNVLFQRIPHIAHLQQIAAEKSKRSAAAATAACLALQEMLLSLAVAAQPAQTKGPSSLRSTAAVDAVAQWLKAKLAEPLNVPQLAKQAGLSRDYLSKRFHERFGLTIPRYLQQLRMEHARLLLSDTDMPIKLIGARVGYPDPQHFNKRFRELERISPTEYRGSPFAIKGVKTKVTTKDILAAIREVRER